MTQDIIEQEVKIAKFRNYGDLSQWWLTNFTMEQVEGRIAFLERENAELKEAFRLVSLRYMAEHDEACRLRQKYEPDGVESESVTRSIERSPE